MDFEFDLKKSAANLAKHGVDFQTAQRLWQCRVLKVPLISSDEPRSLVIGKLDEKHWTAIITERSGRTRIISVRRSREKERQNYEQNEI